MIIIFLCLYQSVDHSSINTMSKWPMMLFETITVIEGNTNKMDGTRKRNLAMDSLVTFTHTD